MRNVIGVDLGGSAIKYALITEHGNILYESQLSSKADVSSDAIIEQIKKAIADVFDYAQTQGLEVSGVGVGSPGIIDSIKGTVIGKAENLKGWENIPLVSILRSEFDCPVYIDNDANVMALAELAYGAACGCTDAVFLTIGTGIGGAMIINRELYGGFRNRGAELGHTPLIAHGEACNCGSVGCFEQYASVTALLRDYKQLLQENDKTIPESIDGKYIITKYHENESEAITALNRHCDYVGYAISGFINIFSPQRVIIGGGISEAGEFYIDKIREYNQKYVINDCGINTEIVKAKLGNLSGCIGAASLVFTA